MFSSRNVIIIPFTAVTNNDRITNTGHTTMSGVTGHTRLFRCSAHLLQAVYLNTTKTPKLRKRHAKRRKDTQRHAKTRKYTQSRIAMNSRTQNTNRMQFLI